jgi:short-subunit dehydrogenase
VTTMCESMSLRYADQNISVSAIMPGYIDTPLARATHPDLEKIPFLIEADKAANMIVAAIEKKKMRYIFPWQVHLMSSVFSAMPRPLFRLLFKWSEK